MFHGFGPTTRLIAPPGDRSLSRFVRGVPPYSSSPDYRALHARATPARVIDVHHKERIFRVRGASSSPRGCASSRRDRYKLILMKDEMAPCDSLYYIETFNIRLVSYLRRCPIFTFDIEPVLALSSVNNFFMEHSGLLWWLDSINEIMDE